MLIVIKHHAESDMTNSKVFHPIHVLRVAIITTKKMRVDCNNLAVCQLIYVGRNFSYKVMVQSIPKSARFSESVEKRFEKNSDWNQSQKFKNEKETYKFTEEQ